MKSLALVGAGFLAGIGYLLACGDGGIVRVDAATDALPQGTCPTCEPLITPDRIYRTESRQSARSSTLDGDTVGSSAACARRPPDLMSDPLLGGGCTIFDKNGGRVLRNAILFGPEVTLPNGPEPSAKDSYRCLYQVQPEDDVIVVATAICYAACTDGANNCQPPP